jgi:hypothetical protein
MDGDEPSREARTNSAWKLVGGRSTEELLMLDSASAAAPTASAGAERSIFGMPPRRMQAVRPLQTVAIPPSRRMPP